MEHWTSNGVVEDPFAGNRRYEIVYADPPWRYRDEARAGRRGVLYKYPLLGDSDVQALPVDQLAADDAVLFLWVTWPKLPEVLPVIDAWGFTYRTVGFVWVKRTRVAGRLAWGMGSYTRANTEPCLIATRGRPKRASAGVHQIVEAPLARHSEKPPEVRDRIVDLMGDRPRIELFAREVVPGWDAWGLDVTPGHLPEPVKRPSPATYGAPSGRGSSHDLFAEPRRRARREPPPLEPILELALSEGVLTRRAVAAQYGISLGQAATALRTLVEQQRLTRLGRGRGSRYVLAAPDGTAGGDG